MLLLANGIEYCIINCTGMHLVQCFNNELVNYVYVNIYTSNQ